MKKLERFQEHFSLRSIQYNFLQELMMAKKASIGEAEQSTSIAYIINTLPSVPLIPLKTPYQTIIIGGSVGRQAICERTENGITILDQSDEIAIPPIHTKDEFLLYVDQLIDERVGAVAINFAYPLKPIFEGGKLDGILLNTTGKAVDAPDLIGERVGHAIEQYMFKKRGKKMIVSVGNDLTCLGLSALTCQKAENIVCGIVGTGTNFGFFPDQTHFVNLESHSFNKFPISDTGEKLAEESGSPFGKETNGGNLYKHFNAQLLQLAIAFPPLKTTKDLDEISRKNIPLLSKLARDLIKRSAQLVACQIAGIADFKKQGMYLAMEGSLFWKANGYKKTVEETVRQLTSQDIQFLEIPDSGIIGAAMLFK